MLEVRIFPGEPLLLLVFQPAGNSPFSDFLTPHHLHIPLVIQRSAEEEEHYCRRIVVMC